MNKTARAVIVISAILNLLLVPSDVYANNLSKDHSRLNAQSYLGKGQALDNPPDKPFNPNPSNGVSGVSTSVTLSVNVSDPDGDPMNVSFYKYGTQNFTVIALPDTQYYSASYPQIFDNQTKWIVNNVGGMNIVFVTHEGDIVDTWNITTPWQNANHSMSKLDGYVPWGILPGNHDLTWYGNPGYGENASYYNQYFGYSRFYGKSWYGGAYQGNNNTNNYELFSAGEDDYLIINLQYGPTDAILDWAGNVVSAYPNRRVIVTTHSYLKDDGSRTTEGAYIWDEFVKPHADHIFLVLSGHYAAPGTLSVARRTDTVNGHIVYQLLADYQYYSNGQSGLLRILKFSPAQDKIFVSTYSPYTNTYLTDSANQFSLDYDMTYSSSTTPEFIGTANNIPSGGVATVSWSNLDYSTTYQWYAVATDPDAVSRQSDIWNFTTYDSLPSAFISPSSVIMRVGQSQLFTSYITGGTNPYSYQWYLDGNSVLGGAGSTPTIVQGAVTEQGTTTPVAGATVTVGNQSVTTDVSGNYVVSNVPIGSMAISASKSGYYFNSDTVEVLSGTNVQNISLTPVSSGNTIFSDDFETSDFSKWTGTLSSDGTITAESSYPHLGTYDAQAALTSKSGAYASVSKDFTGMTTVYTRTYVRFSATPPSGGSTAFIVAGHNFGATDWFARVGLYNVGGTVQWWIRYYSGSSTYDAFSTTPAISTDQYYCLELKIVVSSTAGEYRVYINGVEVITITGVNSIYVGSSVREMRIGASNYITGTSLAVNVYVDDVVIADSYIGPSTGPTGIVQGAVTEQGTTTPVAGATVTVGNQSVTTDVSGNYVVSNVPIGSMAISASKSGYYFNSDTVEVLSGTNTRNIVLTPQASPPTPTATWTYTPNASGWHTVYVKVTDSVGIQTTSNVVTVMVTVPGDITGPEGMPDGKVDSTDLTYIAKVYGISDPIGDFTGPSGMPDGNVDIYELRVLANDYGNHI